MTVAVDPAVRTGTVRSGDVELFYRLFGAPGATPVIILHGANYYDSTDWIDVAGALATDRQVLAFDSRGFGRSGWSPSKDYSPDAIADDVIALLDHLGWKKAVIMGHSMGGGRAILFAARNPDRSAALIMVDHCPTSGVKPLKQSVNNRPDVFPTVEAMQASMSRDRNTPPGSKARARLAEITRKVEGGVTYPRDPDFANAVPVGAESRPPRVVPGDMWQELGSVRCPILLLRGAASDRYDEAKLARMATELPRVRRVDVPSGHDVAGGAPDELIAAVRDFLKAL